jgi:hypothetical protein
MTPPFLGVLADVAPDEELELELPQAASPTMSSRDAATAAASHAPALRLLRDLIT